MLEGYARTEGKDMEGNNRKYYAHSLHGEPPEKRQAMEECLKNSRDGTGVCAK